MRNLGNAGFFGRTIASFAECVYAVHRLNRKNVAPCDTLNARGPQDLIVIVAIHENERLADVEIKDIHALAFTPGFTFGWSAGVCANGFDNVRQLRSLLRLILRSHRFDKFERLRWAALLPVRQP